MVSSRTHSAPDPALVKALRRRVPLDPSVFDDRDDELSQLRWVADVGRRKLYLFPDASAAWGRLREGQLVSFDVVTGEDAADVYYDRVTRLPGERVDAILAALRPGREAGEALREVFGDNLSGLSDVRTTSVAGGEEYIFRVHNGRPYRRGVLALTVDADGRIQEASLPTGRAARRAVAGS